MPAHSEQRESPYTTRQLFDLVADIERYPEFLPWCRAARVLERKEGEMMGELVISFHHLTERYTSRVTLDQPSDDNDEGAIGVAMVEGPFEYLTNRWHFTPQPGGGARIDFFIDFKFRSRLMEKIIGPLFTRAAAKMAAAFDERAHALYGKNDDQRPPHR